MKEIRLQGKKIETEQKKLEERDESDGGQRRDRTAHTRIFSPLLYQLSYLANACHYTDFQTHVNTFTEFFHFFTGRNAMPMRGQIAPTPTTLLYPLFAGFSTRASRLFHVCPSVLACPNSSGTAAFSSAAILTLYPPSPRLSVPSSSPS